MITAVVVLTAVNGGIFPDPLAAKPIEVFEFTQLIVAPAGVLLRVIGATVPPLQTEILEGCAATGDALIVMVVLLLEGQIPFVVKVME